MEFNTVVLDDGSWFAYPLAAQTNFTLAAWAATASVCVSPINQGSPEEERARSRSAITIEN